MADETRRNKVADRIRETVASLLERRIKDPRLGFVTVTDARVTADLQHATVYYTVLGDEAQREQTARGLESAKGLIRSEVGAALGIRLTPSLEFVADPLPESAAQITQTLREARERDAQIAAAAAAAEYAGDPDPYRKADEDADADDEADWEVAPSEQTEA